MILLHFSIAHAKQETWFAPYTGIYFSQRTKQFSIKKIEKLAKGDVIIDEGKPLVEKLQELQQELEKINKEASCELLKVAQKYNRIWQSILEEILLNIFLASSRQLSSSIMYVAGLHVLKRIATFSSF